MFHSPATNISPGPVHIGRFKILPGDALPAIPLTAEEEADIRRLAALGLLELAPACQAATDTPPVPNTSGEAETAPAPDGHAASKARSAKDKKDVGKASDQDDSAGDKTGGSDA